jgi:hypothetical protein
MLPEFAALDPRVDEIELDSDSSKWNITFTAISGGEKTQENTLADLLRVQKIYKVVSIRANDGTLIAVRNPDPF